MSAYFALKGPLGGRPSGLAPVDPAQQRSPAGKEFQQQPIIITFRVPRSIAAEAKSYERQDWRFESSPTPDYSIQKGALLLTLRNARSNIHGLVSSASSHKMASGAPVIPRLNGLPKKALIDLAFAGVADATVDASRQESTLLIATQVDGFAGLINTGFDNIQPGDRIGWRVPKNLRLDGSKGNAPGSAEPRAILPETYPLRFTMDEFGRAIDDATRLWTHGDLARLLHGPGAGAEEDVEMAEAGDEKKAGEAAGAPGADELKNTILGAAEWKEILDVLGTEALPERLVRNGDQISNADYKAQMAKDLTLIVDLAETEHLLAPKDDQLVLPECEYPETIAHRAIDRYMLALRLLEGSSRTSNAVLAVLAETEQLAKAQMRVNMSYINRRRRCDVGQCTALSYANGGDLHALLGAGGF